MEYHDINKNKFDNIKEKTVGGAWVGWINALKVLVLMIKKYIKNLNFTNVVIFLTAFGTLWTSFATYTMVKEMEKQRMASSKPFIKVLANKNAISFVKYTKEGKLEQVKNDNIHQIFNGVIMENFGVGPAFDVKIKFIVNDKDLNTCSKRYFNHASNVRNINSPFYQAIYELSVLNRNIITAMKKGDNETIKLSRDPSKIMKNYLDELYLIINLFSDKSKMYWLPSIDLSLSYTDLNQNRIAQKFKIKQYIDVTKKDNNGNYRMIEKMEISEIKKEN